MRTHVGTQLPLREIIVSEGWGAQHVTSKGFDRGLMQTTGYLPCQTLQQRQCSYVLASAFISRSIAQLDKVS